MKQATIILFGMTRKTAPFYDSFQTNVLNSLTTLGFSVRVVGSLNVPKHVVNPRSGENGEIEIPHALQLRFPEVLSEPQDEAVIAEDLRFFSQFRDRWNDNYRSLGNLLHQLRSLRRGTLMALDRPARLYIFLRPDLVYHDSFTSAFNAALTKEEDCILLPAWQTCGGLNDRFAIATGQRAASIYGLRLDFAHEFTKNYRAGLHAERLLAYALATRRIRFSFLTQRASRVRLDGAVHKENFEVKARRKVRAKIRTFLFPKSYSR